MVEMIALPSPRGDGSSFSHCQWCAPRHSPRLRAAHTRRNAHAQPARAASETWMRSDAQPLPPLCRRHSAPCPLRNASRQQLVSKKGKITCLGGCNKKCQKVYFALLGQFRFIPSVSSPQHPLAPPAPLAAAPASSTRSLPPNPLAAPTRRTSSPQHTLAAPARHGTPSPHPLPAAHPRSTCSPQHPLAHPLAAAPARSTRSQPHPLAAPARRHPRSQHPFAASAPARDTRSPSYVDIRWRMLIFDVVC
jgi:hypothetical protein